MGLQEYVHDMESCCRCNACKFIPLEKITGYEHAECCPSISYHDFHAYSGAGRMGFGIALARGRVDYTPAVADVVYNCTLCGACDVSCKYAMDMDVLEPLLAVRRECVQNGLTVPVWDELVESMRRQGPAVTGTTGKRGEWYQDLEVKDYTKEKVAVVYHAGCLANYDQASGRVARAVVSLLQKAGVDVGIAKEQ